MVHPLAVAHLVAMYTEDEDLVIAALLHDVIEDTVRTKFDIEAMFGSTVAHLVEQLTKTTTHKDGNRAARKKIDNARLAKACSEVKLIKLCDIFDNIQDLARTDPDFAETYIREKLELLPLLNDIDVPPDLFEKVHVALLHQLDLLEQTRN